MHFHVADRRAALLSALASALVTLVRRARGKRVTVDANRIARMAGYRKHGELLLIGRALSLLARKSIIRAEVKRRGRSRVFKYVIEESMELWSMARAKPREASKYILRAVIEGVK